MLQFLIPSLCSDSISHLGKSNHVCNLGSLKALGRVVVSQLTCAPNCKGEERKEGVE